MDNMIAYNGCLDCQGRVDQGPLPLRDPLRRWGVRGVRGGGALRRVIFIGRSSQLSPLLLLLPCLSCKLGFIPGPKKAVPAIDTVLAMAANWCWTVMGGLLSFIAHQAYGTTRSNRRRRH